MRARLASSGFAGLCMQDRGDFADIVGGLAFGENCFRGDAGALLGRKLLFGLVEVVHLVEQERIFRKRAIGIVLAGGLGNANYRWGAHAGFLLGCGEDRTIGLRPWRIAEQ